MYLLESILEDIRFTAGLVRGIASFDITALHTQPLDQVLFCFEALCRSFQLRGWVTEPAETEYRDEYFEFVDQFRNTCGAIQNVPDLVTDIVDLLVQMPAQRRRPRSSYLDRLSSLCLSEVSQALPPLKFHGNNPPIHYVDCLASFFLLSPTWLMSQVL